MCMVVYVASDRLLPIIPWDDEAPAFHVVELTGRDEPVRRQFTKRRVYYVGSHTMCGCEFRYGRPPLLDEAEEKAGRESVRRLGVYLARAVRVGPIELFSCWEGDQGAEPVGRRLVTPAHFGGKGFEFVERELLVVEKA